MDDYFESQKRRYEEDIRELDEKYADLLKSKGVKTLEEREKEVRELRRKVSDADWALGRLKTELAIREGRLERDKRYKVETEKAIAESEARTKDWILDFLRKQNGG